jgi:hypothetical protein
MYPVRFEISVKGVGLSCWLTDDPSSGPASMLGMQTAWHPQSPA